MNQADAGKHAETSSVGWLAREITELERDPEYVADYAALTIIEHVHGLMEAQGITRAQLAERMGVSRAYVTQLFNSPPNMTLQSIAQLSLALGTRPEVKLTPTDCPLA